MTECLVGSFLQLSAGLPAALQSGLQAILEPEVLDRTGAALVGVVAMACLFIIPRA